MLQVLSALSNSQHSYYFSNLKDIYTIVLKEKFPYMKATSTARVIPFLNSQDFDIVILGKNLSLKQPVITLEPHHEDHLWPSLEYLEKIWPWQFSCSEKKTA